MSNNVYKLQVFFVEILNLEFEKIFYKDPVFSASVLSYSRQYTRLL